MLEAPFVSGFFSWRIVIGALCKVVIEKVENRGCAHLRGSAWKEGALCKGVNREEGDPRLGSLEGEGMEGGAAGHVRQLLLLPRPEAAGPQARLCCQVGRLQEASQRCTQHH